MFGKDSEQFPVPIPTGNLWQRSVKPLNIRPSSDAGQAFRVFDANANRAAEGLRTLEDFARLVREDRQAARSLKSLRHKLAAAIQKLSRPERLLARSTETDAGADFSTKSEVQRTQLVDIVPAACERVTQSLRCLEEFAKFVADAGSQEETSECFKQLRYEAYDVLAGVELRLMASSMNDSQQLYLLVDCRLPVNEFATHIQQLAEAGVDLFQLRDKKADGARLWQYAQAAVAALRETTAKFVVNDRVDIALASGADGVHVGQDDLPLEEVQRLARGRLLIGVSTHNLAQAIAAEQGRADYIGCGPTFPSSTKQFDLFAGTSFLEIAAKQIEIPQFAIGGVSPENLSAVLQTGCRRIAVSSAIHDAPDPPAAARELKQQLLLT